VSDLGRREFLQVVAVGSGVAALTSRGAGADAVSPERMKAIYEEVRTPFKRGIVIEPPEGKKVDWPTVFRHGGKWYMVYVPILSSAVGGPNAEHRAIALATSKDLRRSP
jgi:hypothetical protein